MVYHMCDNVHEASNKAEAVGALQNLIAGYTIHFWSPNITWGGNPSVAGTSDRGDATHHFDALHPCRAFKGATAFGDSDPDGAGHFDALNRSKQTLSRESVGAYGTQIVRDNVNESSGYDSLNSKFTLGNYGGRANQSKCMMTMVPKYTTTHSRNQRRYYMDLFC